MSPTADLILALTRQRARRLAGWMEQLWQSGRSSPDQGPAIGPGEVAARLDHAATRAAEAAFHAASGIDVTGAEAALAGDPLWRRINHHFGLTPAETDLLALLIAVELDPGLQRVVAYLQDDFRLTQPTPYLSARLKGQDPSPFFGENLRGWLLAVPVDGFCLTTPWQLDPAAAAAAASGVWRDPLLAGAAEIIVPPQRVLHPEALARLGRIADLRDAELAGLPGNGKRSLAAQFAAQRGQTLLAVDLSRLPDPGQTIIRALRQAVMTGALAYFAGADAVTEADWTRAKTLNLPYLRGVRHPSGIVQSVTVAPLPLAERARLWRSLTGRPPPLGLASQRLTAAEITRAAADPNTPLRARGRRPDHALLAQLPTPYDWDDLVLPADTAAALRAFESQIRLRWSVYDEWGFSRLTHLGQGIAALFGGLSGTGKTMAAQVVAGSLGLDLLRVDLAGVVNKYIGETEKKLREVFDACEDSGAVLFFDEADALFGNRTQVKDAHDRFANIEIDYLLQRIERFDGVAILATNRRQDLDPAFVRRLRFVIEFLPPRPQERLALWQRALLPAGTAILGEIDYSYLAERLIMTGAEIKNTVLSAAFLARAETSAIGMRHIFTAAQREMEKKGERFRMPVPVAAQ
jgi:hypothetical protein